MLRPQDSNKDQHDKKELQQHAEKMAELLTPPQFCWQAYCNRSDSPFWEGEIRNTKKQAQENLETSVHLGHTDAGVRLCP